jgi:hypothetical protein
LRREPDDQPALLSRPGWQADRPDGCSKMRKDVREFMRLLKAVGSEVESTPGHYRVLRELT